jgi:hypothetical protein
MGLVYGWVERMDVKGVTCDRCKKDTRDEHEPHNYHYAKLEAKFGYGSKKDGQKHLTILCEDCYDEILTTFNLKPAIEEEFF